MVLNLGIAFLQPSAVGVGRLARYTAVDTPAEIAPVLIQGGGGQGVSALVDGKGAQQHRLHARRKHGIAGLDGKLANPQLMGQTDLPVLSRVLLLGTVEIRDPDRRFDVRPGLPGLRPAPDWAGSHGCRPARSETPIPTAAARSRGRWFRRCQSTDCCGSMHFVSYSATGSHRLGRCLSIPVIPYMPLHSGGGRGAR